jgi:hypothetical protein
MQKKKPYNKPEIARVEMTPEDAVLTACKSHAPGPGRKKRCNPGGLRCQTRKAGS